MAEQYQYGLQPPQGGYAYPPQQMQGGLQPPYPQQYPPQQQQQYGQPQQYPQYPQQIPPQVAGSPYDNSPNKPDDKYPDGIPSPSYDYDLLPPEDQSGVETPPQVFTRPPGTPKATGIHHYPAGEPEPRSAPRGSGPVKRALLVGINYTGTSKELRGCHNDVKNMFSFLTQTCQFDPDDILTLTDVSELQYLNRSLAEAESAGRGGGGGGGDTLSRDLIPADAMHLITKLMGKSGGFRHQAAHQIGGMLKSAMLEYMGQSPDAAGGSSGSSGAPIDTKTMKKNLEPTRHNILRGIDWLTRGLDKGDTIFFHYSGHGGQVPDEDGDEEDGLDECIYPLDFQSAGPIIDDELHDCLVKKVPDGARLVSVLDCCHSGTGLDLPYSLEPEIDGQHSHVKHEKRKKKQKKNKKKNKKKDKKSKKSKKKDKKNKKKSRDIDDLIDSRLEQQRGNHGFQKHSSGLSVCFSGCEDSQTSADTNIGGKYTGALSYALLEVLQKHKGGITYADILFGMRDQMLARRTMSQIPQLTFNRADFDVHSQFTL